MMMFLSLLVQSRVIALLCISTTKGAWESKLPGHILKVLIVVAFCFAKIMAPVGAAGVAVVFTVDDPDDSCSYWGGPDVEGDIDGVLVVSNLDNARNYRW